MVNEDQRADRDACAAAIARSAKAISARARRRSAEATARPAHAATTLRDDDVAASHRRLPARRARAAPQQREHEGEPGDVAHAFGEPRREVDGLRIDLPATASAQRRSHRARRRRWFAARRRPVARTARARSRRTAARRAHGSTGHAAELTALHRAPAGHSTTRKVCSRISRSRNGV